MSFSAEWDGLSGAGVDFTLFPKSFEEIGTAAMRTVMPDVEQATKHAVRSSVQHPGDSDLVNSIRCFEPSMTKNGEGVKLACLPTGAASSGNTYYTTHSHGNRRAKKVYNNDKAFWLEYGRQGQEPRPWRDRALNDAEQRTLPKLEDAIAKEIGAE